MAKKKTAMKQTPAPVLVMPPPETTALSVVEPMMVLQRAVQDGAGVDVLERLLGLQERWEATRARKAFDAAMAALRADLPTIIKRSVVDFTTAKGRTNYKYEDLASVTEAVSPAMAAQGLSFRWQTDSSQPGAISVTCIVSHADGHTERTTLSAAADQSGNKNDIQAIGSAVTYLQRYTLKAAIGIAAAVDDDGQARTPQPSSRRRDPDDTDVVTGEVVRSRPAPKPVKPVAHNPKAGEVITADQLKRLWTIARKSGRQDEAIKQWLIARYGIESSKDIRRADYEDIVAALEHPGPLSLTPDRSPGEDD